jgi:hypothetical protein
MISAGQTKATDIGVGRQLLCKEKPGTPVASQCAKQLTATVTAAKKGLTAKQQQLWQKYVYTSALLQAQRFCDGESKRVILGARVPGGEGTDASSLTTTQKYKKCVVEVLSGTKKIKGPFKTEFKWSDFLINGTKIIKKLPPKAPMLRFRGNTPGMKH